MNVHIDYTHLIPTGTPVAASAITMQAGLTSALTSAVQQPHPGVLTVPTTFRLSSNPANLRTYAPHATVEAAAEAAYEAFHERQEERRGR